MDDKLRDFMRCQDDYGGMRHDMYDAIVAFKRDGTYPDFAQERSARTAWKLRCVKYALLFDDETLVYINQNGPQKPRFVVKVGEPASIIGRVHEMIGHLGTKRTQMAIMRRFYWRSVRADIQRFVEACEHCRAKKITGQKLLKAPIDVTKDDCIEVTVRSKLELKETPESRFIISIEGIDESVYPLFLNARMTSYTFKETHNRRPVETAPRIRGRPYSKRKIIAHPQQKPPAKLYIPMGHCLDGFHDIYARRPEYITGDWVQLNELDKWMSNANEPTASTSEECPVNIEGSPLQKPRYVSERSGDSLALGNEADQVVDEESTLYDSDINSIPIGIRMRCSGYAARNAAIIAGIPDTVIDPTAAETATLIEAEPKMEFDELAIYCSIPPIY